MKKIISAVVVGLLIAGCSSNPARDSDAKSAQLPKDGVQNEKLVTEFNREGIKIHYSLFGGSVEKIEVYGYANVWQKQYAHVAELDAKEKLVKFLRGESVSSERKTNVIAKALELAQDKSLTATKSSDGKIITPTAENLELADPAKDVEIATVKDFKDIETANQDQDTKADNSTRKAAIQNAQVVTSNVTVTAKGLLAGVHMVKDGAINDGKTYFAVYEWTPRGQTAARSIAAQMDGKVDNK